MTDPFFGPLVEAIDPFTKILPVMDYLEGPGEVLYEWQTKNGTAKFTKSMLREAENALTSHDPAPVLRVLRAAYALNQEACQFDEPSYKLDSVDMYVDAWVEFSKAVDALLEVPTYREWLEGES